jgi:hypothetical protein
MSDEKGRRVNVARRKRFEKIICAYIAATGAEVLSVATDLCCCVVACCERNQPRRKGPTRPEA